LRYFLKNFLNIKKGALNTKCLDCSKELGFIVISHGNTRCNYCNILYKSKESAKAKRKEISCKFCGSLFKQGHCSQVYCSDKCRNKAGDVGRGKKIKVCICGNEFEVCSKTRKHCSEKCRLQASKKPKQPLREKRKNKSEPPKVFFECKYCGKTTKKKRPNQTYCSSKCYKQDRSDHVKHSNEEVKLMPKIHCAECDKEFQRTMYDQRFCSKQCGKKNGRHLSQLRKRINGTVDETVTLTKLYARDNGKCHICGKQANYQDFTVENNGVFISGNSYPSIDHIMPVSKGGTHTWDNVALSHRICNSIKSDNPYFETETGQLRLAL
jgi:predicted nucleic acid-binding Zn ribbon protein